jgi:EAL domain-containing protein (putative c-di-GMP-specific phosphodiesterase class I)
MAALCAEPLIIEGIALRAAVVLGVAVAPLDAATGEECLRCAHAAAESALSAGQVVAHFVQASDEAQRRRLKLGADLPLALQGGQLHLLYQPKRHLAEGRIDAVEALVRWHHPVFGEVSPVEFVPIAERTGTSAQLTRWVLRVALEQQKRWHQQGLRIGMAVNLSAADLPDETLLQDILGALRDTGLPAGSLTLEVTESVLLQDAQLVRGNIQLLRVAGVRFSIDDFGTGYSSLSQLRELQADELKIDRSFVRGALQGAEDAAMLQAIVQMARGMGLATVAEGVEHEAQSQMLRELGCDYAQGYLISRPVPGDELAPLLRLEGARRVTGDTGVTALRSVRQRDSG